MKMYYFRHPMTPNFGDELNLWLWPQLLEHVFDNDETSLFIGIGSVLSNDYPANVRKYVMGAGYGAYWPPPVLDETWDISFVRGPQTARALGLEPKKAITDSAILIRAVRDCRARPKRFKASFIPHWHSLYTGYWELVCQWAGVNLIDPRNPVEQVLDEITASEVVIAEAMHGAIVADALRVPWIPVLPLAPEHRFKWTDWTQSLGVDFKPFSIAPSSWTELKTTLSRTGHRSGETSGGISGLLGSGSRLQRVARSKPGRLVEKSLSMAAAARLRWLSTREPILSRDTVIADLSERALEKVHAFSRIHSRSAA